MAKKKKNAGKAQQPKAGKTTAITDQPPLPDGVKQPRNKNKKKWRNNRRRMKQPETGANMNNTTTVTDKTEGEAAKPLSEVQFVLSRLSEAANYVAASEYLKEFTKEQQEAYVQKYILKKYEPVLLVPRFVRFCDEYGRDAEPKATDDKTEALERLKYWPHTPFHITKAPMLISEEEIGLLHAKEQTGAMFKVMNIVELAFEIVKQLPRESIKNLMITCSEAHKTVSQLWNIWNLTESSISSALDRPDSTGNKISATGYFVVASPVRPTQKALNRNTGLRMRTSYDRQYCNTLVLYRAIVDHGSAIRVLHLHRVPFLDIHGLKLMLAGDFDPLPNLQELGVYRCELIHFGDTPRLLAIAKERKEMGRSLDVLDLSPRFHQGPLHNDRLGSFGVSWSDVGFDTPEAIAGHLIWKIIPLATELGFDFTSDDSAFRQWLEKLPLPDLYVPQVLALAAVFVRENLRDRITMQIATADIPQEFLKCLYCVTQQEMPGKWQRKFRKPDIARCDTCEDVLPLFLFRAHRLGYCAGCQVGMMLNFGELDHYKIQKKYITEIMLRDPRQADPATHNNSSRSPDFITSVRDLVDDANYDRREHGRTVAAGFHDGLLLAQWLESVFQRHQRVRDGPAPPPGFFDQEKLVVSTPQEALPLGRKKEGDPFFWTQEEDKYLRINKGLRVGTNRFQWKEARETYCPSSDLDEMRKEYEEDKQKAAVLETQ